jgi:crotonobetainyl-CoA:carnitine CoA-transferase CaiB-like acyl-CoA transferase
VRDRWKPGPTRHAPVNENRPLAGVRVLEICDWVIGPYAGAILRQLGAEVWKLESLTGDNAQLMSFVYLPVNSGKEVLRVDLGHPDGQAVLRDLIRAADVVMHNHRPKGAKRLGFDGDTVRALNADAVYHEMVSFGLAGPLAGDPAFDHLVAARAGLPWIQGGMSAGNPPVLFNGSSGDLPGGIITVLAVCAGLYQRARRGSATTSWSALFEAGYFLNFAENVLYEGRPQQPEGGVDHLGPSALRRLYRSADGWLLLSVTHPVVWDEAVKLLAIDPLPFADAVVAPADGDLAAAIEARLADRTGPAWEADALAVGVPLVVPRIDRDVVTEPHITVNGYQSEGRHADLGSYRYPAHLVQVGGRPDEPVFEPPDPAASARRILGRLGYGPERISALAEGRVIVA